MKHIHSSTAASAKADARHEDGFVSHVHALEVIGSLAPAAIVLAAATALMLVLI